MSRAGSVQLAAGGDPVHRLPPTAYRLLREAGLFALFLLLSIAMTWPLAIQMDTAVSDLGDPLLNTWIVDWSSHALLHQPLRLFAPKIFWPELLPLAYSEHLVGVALLVLPFHLAGAEPLVVYNIAMILGFALSGYGAFVLARMFTPSLAAAIAGGIFYAFVPFKFDHLAHLQIVSSGWIPLFFAALVAYWRNATKRNAVLLAAAFVMNGLTNVYYLLFVAATLGVTLLFFVTAAPKRDLRFWIRLLTALAVAGLVLLPFLLPYKIVSDTYHFTRSEEEVRHGSATWRAWLAGSFRSLWWRDLVPEEWKQHERLLFPGLMAPLLLLVALLTRKRPTAQPTNQPTDQPTNGYRFHWLDPILILAAILSLLGMYRDRVTWRVAGHLIFAMRGTDVPMMALVVGLMIRLPLRRWLERSRFTIEEWFAAVWLITGFIASFGMNAFFFSFLFRRVFVFESLRASSRFAVIAYAALAIWVALGITALARRRKIAGAFCVALVLVDLLPVIRWEQWTGSGPLYRWLAKSGIEPTVELPVHGWWEAQYLVGWTEHRRLASLNGTSGWEPPQHFNMRLEWEQKKFDELFTRAETNGAKVLVIHAHWLEDNAVRDALRRAVESGRLHYLRRFDHGIEGDFVFAFAKNFRDWQRFRAEDLPDGAGNLPAQTVARFLDNQPTHNTTAFGQIDTPTWDSTVTGPLRVTGWTISPNFIREVWVLVDEGRHRYKAERVERPEIAKKYWWYYEARPGFAVDIPKKPLLLPRATDVQVEVVDRNGRRTRLNNVLFYWE
jgi:hypothetical protein